MLNRIGAVLARTYPVRLAMAFGDSQAGNYASGLAFTSFVSMFPLILGLLAVLGLVTSGPHLRHGFINAVFGFFPVESRAPLTAALDGVRQHSGLLGVISLAGTLWSGSALFTSMEFALGRVIGAGQRDFLRQRAMTFLMTLLFAIAVVATVFLNSVAAVMQGIPQLAPVLGLVVWLAFMTAIYRLVPNRTYTVRRMWPGVLLAGVLMEALTLLWPLYTRLTHGFNTYGSAFALFFVLATWLYFFALFTLLGAVANRMHAGGPSVGGLIATRTRDEPV